MRSCFRCISSSGEPHGISKCVQTGIDSYFRKQISLRKQTYKKNPTCLPIFFLMSMRDWVEAHAWEDPGARTTSVFFYLISLGWSGYWRWPEPWPMTVHGHQFSFRARSSRTAANCLTRATAKVKVEGLCLLPGGHPSNHYRSQVLLNFWDLTGSGVSNTPWS